MQRNFLEWRRPEGAYPERDGKFIIVAPTLTMKEQRQRRAADARRATATIRRSGRPPASSVDRGSGGVVGRPGARTGRSDARDQDDRQDGSSALPGANASGSATRPWLPLSSSTATRVTTRPGDRRDHRQQRVAGGVDRPARSAVSASSGMRERERAPAPSAVSATSSASNAPPPRSRLDDAAC